MKLTAAFFALAASVVAFDLGPDHQFQAPGPDDVRSPCPGLNILANHGFLPRSGRNLTVENVLAATKAGFNVAVDTLFIAARMGSLTSTDLEFFSLESIRLHGNIEHDASLSRGDTFFGDNYSFNETLFSALADQPTDDDFYNTTTVGHALKRRLGESQATNPNLTNTPAEIAGRSGTSALYLTTMGDPLTGIAPKEFVNVFFREERFPIEDGWKPSEIEITASMLGAVAQAVAEASDWAPNDPSEPASRLTVVLNTKGELTQF